MFWNVPTKGQPSHHTMVALLLKRDQQQFFTLGRANTALPEYIPGFTDARE
jgi:hypothetical protein